MSELETFFSSSSGVVGRFLGRKLLSLTLFVARNGDVTTEMWPGPDL